jgi:hypothetical protein
MNPSIAKIQRNYGRAGVALLAAAYLWLLPQALLGVAAVGMLAGPGATATSNPSSPASATNA